MFYQIKKFHGCLDVTKPQSASIHRCAAALAAANDSFNRRLDYEVQSPKFFDVWPIENVWGIEKERVAQQKC